MSFLTRIYPEQGEIPVVYSGVRKDIEIIIEPMDDPKYLIMPYIILDLPFSVVFDTIFLFTWDPITYFLSDTSKNNEGEAN